MATLREGIKSTINAVLGPFGYAVRHKAYFDPLESLFHRYLHADFFFVQIGANDGTSHDPIYRLVTRSNVAGLVVEPIPEYFEKLAEAYKARPRIIPVNKAIHATDREVTMYRVDPAMPKGDLPRWADGIASLHPNHHRLSGIPDSAMVAQTVPALSFGELVRQYGVTHIDLLQIDTEGYDFEIVKMANIDEFRPKIVSFEHGLQHGVMSRETFRECTEYLLGRGYHMLIQEYDAIAYLP
jgi:FkbM family methyltransferase